MLNSNRRLGLCARIERPYMWVKFEEEHYGKREGKLGKSFLSLKCSLD